MSYITPKRKARKDRKKAKNLNTDFIKNLFLTDNFWTGPCGDAWIGATHFLDQSNFIQSKKILINKISGSQKCVAPGKKLMSLIPKNAEAQSARMYGEKASQFFSLWTSVFSAPLCEIKYIFFPGKKSKSKFLVTCYLLKKHASIWRLCAFCGVFLFHIEKINMEKYNENFPRISGQIAWEETKLFCHRNDFNIFLVFTEDRFKNLWQNNCSAE